MLGNAPCWVFPLPISRVMRPLAFVVAVWVSTYTGVPFSEPCSTLTRTPTLAFVTNWLVALRTTAW